FSGTRQSSPQSNQPSIAPSVWPRTVLPLRLKPAIYMCFKADAMGKSYQVKLDIVGCGAVVEGVHVPLLRLLRRRFELEVVGCYDRNLEQARRTAAALGARRWGAEASPQEGDEVDGALVATPPAAHAE